MSLALPRFDFEPEAATPRLLGAMNWDPLPANGS
jgi:hypothetical protein